jgi:hypothetical protein
MIRPCFDWAKRSSAFVTFARPSRPCPITVRGGFCAVRRRVPRIDVGALSGALFDTAVQAAAESVVLTIDHLDEEENTLNQNQKISLVHETMRSFANLEAVMAKTLIDELEREDVEVWGLSSELESLLGNA